MAKDPTVTVAPDRLVYVHPDHVDGLRAPDADQLAPNGIPTASARAAGAGEKVTVPAGVADQLERDGAIER